MNNPRVSVIMPSYNKERFIKKSIESIISQTYQDWELIIFDDCSSDKSTDIIESMSKLDNRIKFQKNRKNIGIAANRNRAIDIAKGEYIALLDADDISLPNRLASEVDYLDSNENIDVVFGGYMEINENDEIKETYFTPLKNPKYIKANLLVLDVIPNGSCMYRKSFVDRYNIRYRDGYLGMDDYLFWVECSLHGNISGIPELFLYWRNTSNNGTNTYKYDERYRHEREMKYFDILNIALEGNGFNLSQKEKSIYFKMLSEYKYRIKDMDEIASFYKVLKKICEQAEGKDNAAEIRKVMRKQFGQSLENSYIWD